MGLRFPFVLSRSGAFFISFSLCHYTTCKLSYNFCIHPIKLQKMSSYLFCKKSRLWNRASITNKKQKKRHWQKKKEKKNRFSFDMENCFVMDNQSGSFYNDNSFIPACKSWTIGNYSPKWRWIADTISSLSSQSERAKILSRVWVANQSARKHYLEFE